MSLVVFLALDGVTEYSLETDDIESIDTLPVSVIPASCVDTGARLVIMADGQRYAVLPFTEQVEIIYESAAWIVPNGVTSVFLEAWGAGGGGGGYNPVQDYSSGGGGGGGGGYEGETFAVDEGDAIAVIIGAGGVPGSSAGVGSAGAAGTDTTWTKAGILVTGFGGSGGELGGDSVGGLGGAGGAGVLWDGGNGGNGGDGTLGNGGGGGGGGSASATSIGGNGGNGDAGVAGVGGTKGVTDGLAGDGGNGAMLAAAVQGLLYGGGGGGAAPAKGAAKGGIGVARVTYTVSV